MARQIYPVSRGLDWLNNTYEAAFMKIIPTLALLKVPTARVNQFFSRLVFAFTVDMWLFRQVTPTVAALREEESPDAPDRPTQKGDARTARAADMFISFFAAIGEWLSKLAGLMDKYVVDGIVNGIGWLTLRAGKWLRPMQTGYVQTYGYVMVAGAVVIIFVFGLAFFGVIKTL